MIYLWPNCPHINIVMNSLQEVSDPWNIVFSSLSLKYLVSIIHQENYFKFKRTEANYHITTDGPNYQRRP